VNRLRAGVCFVDFAGTGVAHQCRLKQYSTLAIPRKISPGDFMRRPGLEHDTFRIGITAQKYGRSIADVAACIDDESRIIGQRPCQSLVSDDIAQYDVLVFGDKPKGERMEQPFECMRYLSPAKGHLGYTDWAFTPRQ
jgi:hypothetical protein